ncbi:MAG TPA: aminopeptidase P family N-terminal domain-containing protein [Xanthobacteraceae bacterium]
MRRGLIARSQVELPDAALAARLDRVRAAMQGAHLDALVIYSNITRPAGASWLTAFVPYWSEALLVVPREGPPYLVAALSFRVKTWIERTSRLGEVLHSPRIGLKAAQQIAAAKSDAVVGIVEFDGLPAGIADDMREGGAGLAFVDASALFAPLRGKADPAEIALATKAASIAHRALGDVESSDKLDAMVAAIERSARNLGAEEIYIAVAPDLDRDCRLMRIEGAAELGQTFALRATIAYKGTWVRLLRSFGDPALERQVSIQFSEALAQLPSDRGFLSFRSWLVEGCRTTQPLEPLMGSRIDKPIPPPPGALLSVQGVLAVDGRTFVIGAPALTGVDGEAASLLIEPLYD